MDYGQPNRNFPSWPRSIAAVAAALLLPSLLWVHVTGRADSQSFADLRELLLLLAIYVGQSAVIAIPAVLLRWTKMSSPLLECVLLGAFAAPGPIGYFGIVMVSTFDIAAAANFFLMLASLGAIGGFTGWAVATDLGRQPES